MLCLLKRTTYLEAIGLKLKDYDTDEAAGQRRSYHVRYMIYT